MTRRLPLALLLLTALLLAAGPAGSAGAAGVRTYPVAVAAPPSSGEPPPQPLCCLSLPYAPRTAAMAVAGGAERDPAGPLHGPPAPVPVPGRVLRPASVPPAAPPAWSGLPVYASTGRLRL